MRDTLRRDVVYALRGLRRAPAFTLIVVLTLGAGLGAAAAVFSVVNGVLLRPLPYREPERLVMIWNDFGQGAQSLPATSATDYLDYERETTLFEGFAAGTGGSEVGATGVLTGDGASERVELTPISANLLPLLGVKPMLGRAFTADEEALQGPKVVILTYGLWRRRYGADRAIVGKIIQLDAVSHTVVGVLPPDFRLHLPAEVYAIREGDVYTPLQIDRANLPPRNLTTLTVFGRIKPGVTLAQAQDEMNRVAARFRATYPEHKMSQVRIRAVPLRHDVVKGVEPTLLILLSAVGLLVLIACANVANLLLARATVRERELAIRQAMGAGRGQIVRQLLTESLILAALAGVLGVALAYTALAVLARLAPATLPRLADVGVDWTVAGFTVLLCLGTAVLFGLAPALHAVGPGSGDVLRTGGRVANAGRRGRIRNALIAAEIALSLVLLVGGGLLVRSFLALQRVRPGFEPAGVLTFQVSLPFAAYPEGAKRKEFWEELERRLTRLPGVTSAARSNQLPLTGSGALQPYAYDEETARNFESVTAEARWVSPSYFTALGTRVLAGRPFTPRRQGLGAQPRHHRRRPPGQARLGPREPDRETAPARADRHPQPERHGRGRGGSHPDAGPRRLRPARHLQPVPTVADRVLRGAHRRRSRVADSGRAPRGRGNGREPAGVGSPADAGVRGRCARGAETEPAADAGRGRAGAAARHHRDLRGDLVQREPAPAGVRRADRARRDAEPADPQCGAAGCQAGGRQRRHRAGRGGCRDASPVGAALRREPRRSADFRERGRPAHRGRAPGLLRPRQAGLAGRSAQHSAERLTRPRSDCV